MAWPKSSAALLLLAALAPASAPAQPTRQEAVEPHMGTLVRIVFDANDATPARAAFARIAAINRALSDYDPASDLNQLCQSQSATLTGDLARILPQALALARETRGAYDPTLAALTRHMLAPPSLHGHQRVTLRGRRITLNGVCFDLGGIAKGYAAQEALRTLRQQGIKRALVALSGDICVSGKGWRVASQGRTITLDNACISTSGNDAQPGHIFDPRTAQRVTREGQVTVISPSGPRADALATAHHVTSPAGAWIDERR
ncbi:MAG: FAD:protein FMN transferase [Acidobacteria bacterium]|nr:FAD:protein FMN transferase [Acidobacteriota bacterium]